MKDLLKMQIMNLKGERLSDEDIAARLRIFYGFAATLKPRIHIQTADSMETSDSSPAYVNLEPDCELAERIHSLYLQNGFSFEEIRDKLSDFSAYLRKLDEENEQKLLQAKEAASASKMKQKRQKGKKPTSSQREVLPSSMVTSSSTSALPPMQKNPQLDLASILRRGSGDGFPYSPISAAGEQRVKSPKRRASFGSHFEVSATSSQDGADSIPPDFLSPKKLLSPIHGTDSGEGDGFYRVKRKAPLPWKQQTVQSNDEIPVSGVFSKDSRDVGSIDSNAISAIGEGAAVSFTCVVLTSGLQVMLRQ